ncbi:hypothetical protein D3C72_1769810 [compost metagenome]
MLELAPQRALRDARLRREFAERVLAELTALDAAQHACEQRRQIPALRRREFGPAAQAGAQPVLLRRGCEAKVLHIVFVRRPGRADRAAIDAGGQHAGEEAAVEARIPGEPGGVALLAGEAGDDLVLMGIGRWQRVHGMGLGTGDMFRE